MRKWGLVEEENETLKGETQYLEEGLPVVPWAFFEFSYFIGSPVFFLTQRGTGLGRQGWVADSSPE